MIMAIKDASGLPVSVDIQIASPYEVKLAESTIVKRFVKAIPGCIVEDKAYDREPLDEHLRQEYGMEPVATHKTNGKKLKTQDGRPLRRYLKRWKVERLIAWLHNFRRIGTRYEYYAENFPGMLQLGCAIILLRHF